MDDTRDLSCKVSEDTHVRKRSKPLKKKGILERGSRCLMCLRDKKDCGQNCRHHPGYLARREGELTPLWTCCGRVEEHMLHVDDQQIAHTQHGCRLVEVHNLRPTKAGKGR